MWTVLKRSFLDFLEDDMLTYAAALSYHLLIALFPFLIFLLALLSFLNLSGLFETLLAQAQQALPREAFQQVRDVLAEVVDQRQGGLLSFGIVASIWFASIGMRSIMNALNRAYDLPEGRSRLERYSLSVGYTVGFAVLVVAATALMVVGPQAAAWVAGRLGMDSVVVEVWRWTRIPVALLLAMVAVSLVYYFAPNIDRPFRVITPGSVIAVLLWVVVTVLFQLYVQNFGRYSVTYGSIGAVIVLLLYLFLSGTVLLFGGEINSVIEQSAPRPDDSRSGPVEPAR